MRFKSTHWRQSRRLVSLSVLSSTLLRVHLRIDVTHALLTHALVVSVNTGATEYSFTAQQKCGLTFIFHLCTKCVCLELELGYPCGTTYINLNEFK